MEERKQQQQQQDIIPFEEYKLPPLGHAISGAVGSTIANLFIYPLDIATIRLQLKKEGEKKKTGILDTIRNIYKKEDGLHGLYAGLGSDTLATVLSSFIYFYCYTALRNVQEVMNKSIGKPYARLNTAQELFLGAEAALISRLFTTPVSNITTRLQVSPKNGFKETAFDIFKEKGLTGFWTGYRASIILVTNPSITYFMFEKIKATFLRTQKKTHLTGFQVFLFSALAKSIATMVTYPFIFTRAKMVGDNGDKKGILETIKYAVQKDGISGLYKGMQAQIMKGFFSQGIMYMIKDYVATYLALVFYHSFKLKMKATAASK
ncbi:mitochondrial carrier domain-containing protein [Cokeromyces recurvatus]|uniref:mitochondrial carrier domain-containing protein n=1 Tax=Cokeromyces recurvatus TaxID=90255 RepID=UPI00221F353A|nr:mitochondrial carrier domain-containing protein [Cokeromyces recurvatus]KAI7905325.1 mitochondrial carrier domain-containing protein [Cokeromyces recurvatus]